MKNKQSFTAATGAKSAFTLAEMLMVLFIIGILTVFSILTLKRREDEYGPLYYRAFEALKIANYNVFIDLYPKFPRPYPTAVNANTIENKTGDDDTLRQYFKTTPGGICQRLLEYINVSEGQINCGAELIDPTKGDSQFDGNLNSGGHLAFKGSNSQRFYFGKKPANIETGELDKDGHKIKLGWFIVYVDLNGGRGPNSTTVKDGRAPDIVAFALTDQGQIAPIGLPRVERKFLTAKVGYPHTYCTGDYPTKYGCTTPGDVRIEKRFSNTMTYDEAVKRAWGITRTYQEADTIDFTVAPTNPPNPAVLKGIAEQYKDKFEPPPPIEKVDIDNGSKASAAADGLPGDCIEGDPLENPCKVLIEKYQK